MSEPSTTRAEEISRYVELSALDVVLQNIVLSTGGDAEGLRVHDAEGGSSEAFDALWPPEGLDGFEDDPLWQLAQAESSALTARIFARLAASPGREFCSNEAADHAERAEKAAEKARELLVAGVPPQIDTGGRS